MLLSVSITIKSGCKASSRLVVAAIDFGNTYSGLAFSFNYEYNADPTKVSCIQQFRGSHVDFKVPTTVLVQPDGKTLEAFGYDAEDKYEELVLDGEHGQYYYFKRLNTMLFGKDMLKRNVKLTDDVGKALPALRVFSLAFSYLRKDLLDSIHKRFTELDQRDIHWVITVPAILDDAAKQFMKEAAIEGGIPIDQVTQVLVPEAASLFCRLLPVQRSVGPQKTAMSGLKLGTKYLVLDAGGETVDITVHQMMPVGSLMDRNKVSGGAWGGKMVNQAFIQLLTRILGESVLQKLKQSDMHEYLDIMRDFEIKKRNISQDKSQKVSILFPVRSLSEIYRNETSKDLKETLAQSSLGDRVSFAGNKLRVEASVIKTLFKSTTDSITSHLQQLLREPELRGTDTILMVGGFSKSPMLQEAIRSCFPTKNVIVPDDAGLAVLIGAVMFGHYTS